MAKFNENKLIQSVVTWGTISVLAFFISVSFKNNSEVDRISNNQKSFHEEIKKQNSMILKAVKKVDKKVSSHDKKLEDLSAISQGLVENQKIICEKIPTITEIEKKLMNNNIVYKIRPIENIDTVYSIGEMFN